MTQALAIKRVNIVGAGNVGISLAALCQALDVGVHVFSRHPQRAERDLLEHDLSFTVSPISSLSSDESTLIFIAVADPDIRKCCEDIAPLIKAHSLVAHLAGALTSDELVSAQACGASIASAHPLNTFPSLEAGLALLHNTQHRTPMFCEGDDRALLRLVPFLTQLGFECHQLNRGAKVLYHAACVMACNYLTALIDASSNLAAGAGIAPERFIPALMPILKTTLANIEHSGTQTSLSGPIARGDAGTLQKHTQAIELLNRDSDQNGLNTEHLHSLYVTLGRHAVAMQTRNDSLSSAEIDNLLAQLKDS